MLKQIPETQIISLPDNLKFNWVKAYYTTSCLGYYEHMVDLLKGLLSWRLEENATFHISKFEILPAYRGNNSGSEFLKEIEVFAKKLNCNVVDLWVEEDTQEFYKRNSYQCTGKLDFVNNCNIVEMSKIIFTIT